MCGIAGFQGEFDVDLGVTMCSSLAHRGPDGSGVLAVLDGQGPTTLLAHRRLSIIDLSPLGAQPMRATCSACGSIKVDESIYVTYNGEIYNFPELRDRLRASGHSFVSQTDTEVLLHLYAAHGLAFLGELNGIFALALVDLRKVGRPPEIDRGDLLLARDPVGVKPLYVHESTAGVAFASELKALMHVPTVSHDIDSTALNQTLAYLWTPAPRTMLRTIQKLRPGESVIVRKGRCMSRRVYDNLAPAAAQLPAQDVDPPAALRRKLEDAVRRQLMSDVPVGAFLSGGLDSTAVVALMKRAQPRSQPQCFTIDFDEAGDIDGSPLDYPFAKRAAEALGVQLHTVSVGAQSLERLDEVIYSLDEPTPDPAALNAYLIAEGARHRGIPVLLSGIGGDDLFGGYRRHRALRYEATWSWLPARARSFVALESQRALGGAGPLASAGRTTIGRRIAKVLALANESDRERLTRYFEWTTSASRHALISPSFACDATDVNDPLLASVDEMPTATSKLSRMLHLEVRHFLADHNLNYADKTGMAFGVETRVPLLDLEVVRFASCLRDEWTARGTAGKKIFRESVADIVPDFVLRRRKSGFGLPIRSWVGGKLAPIFDDTLSPDSVTRRGIFQPNAVSRIRSLTSAGLGDSAYTLFALMWIERWCRLFVDQAPARLATAKVVPEFVHL